MDGIMDNIVTVGSKTSTNREVMPGANKTVMLNGLPIALIGDFATCSCGSTVCNGIGEIIAISSRNTDINDNKWAMVGDFVNTGCGVCFLVANKESVNVGCDMKLSWSVKGNV